jgi:hypothetical protein
MIIGIMGTMPEEIFLISSKIAKKKLSLLAIGITFRESFVENGW